MQMKPEARVAKAPKLSMQLEGPAVLPVEVQAMETLVAAQMDEPPIASYEMAWMVKTTDPMSLLREQEPPMGL